MADNGSAYRSIYFATALAKAGIRRVRTWPSTPQANGKPERFIQTGLFGWAYARSLASSTERQAAIGPWANRYNLSRPHSALGDQRRVCRRLQLLRRW